MTNSAPREQIAGVTITCASSTPAERAVAGQVAGLLRRYDLARWRFTHDVRIEDWVIPHSHPVLTLNTRRYPFDGPLLATYLHEQLHWFATERAAGAERAIEALRARYPNPPVGHPDGAQDTDASLLHYAICYLEWWALLEVVGQEEAARIFAFWRTDHYRAIYATVMDDTEAIGAIVTREIGLP